MAAAARNSTGEPHPVRAHHAPSDGARVALHSGMHARKPSGMLTRRLNAALGPSSAYDPQKGSSG
jgi:hypothetical protein